jgi:hypothetical protein
MLSNKVINVVNNEIMSIYKQAIMDCAGIYNFDVEEAISKLSENMKKPVVSKKSEKKEKTEKMKLIPLPWTGEVNELHCLNIKMNHGLYTQCPGLRLENGYCKSCKEMCGDYYTVNERLEKGADYKDAKGRKPVNYLKVMKKLKLSREEVEMEAGKNNKILNNELFEEVKLVKEKKEKSEKKEKKGRPKKPDVVISSTENPMEDLFKTIVAENTSEVEEKNEENNTVISEITTSSNKSKKSKMSDEEKAAKEAKKLAEKAEKEAKKVAEKEAKEAKKLAEKEEKELKKKELEDQKNAKKLAEKQEKELKKKELEEAKKVAKESKKSVKKSEKSPKEEKVEEVDVTFEKMIDGKKYKISKTSGNVYDEDDEIVGKFDAKTKELEFFEEEEELGEEDVESENDE